MPVPNVFFCRITQPKWQSQYLNPGSSLFTPSNHLTLTYAINVSSLLFYEILVNSEEISLTFQARFVQMCSVYRNRINKVRFCEISIRKLIIKAARSFAQSLPIDDFSSHRMTCLGSTMKHLVWNTELLGKQVQQNEIIIKLECINTFRMAQTH